MTYKNPENITEISITVRGATSTTLAKRAEFLESQTQDEQKQLEQQSLELGTAAKIGFARRKLRELNSYGNYKLTPDGTLLEVKK